MAFDRLEASSRQLALLFGDFLPERSLVMSLALAVVVRSLRLLHVRRAVLHQPLQVLELLRLLALTVPLLQHLEILGGDQLLLG